MATPRLCYVDRPFAYFTTRELGEQWGDDWNYAPYEHNAGEPYTDPGFEVIKIAFESEMETPADRSGRNSAYSVEMINAGLVPWLSSPYYSDRKDKIMAGATVDEFIDAIEAAGGTVYLPRNA